MRLLALLLLGCLHVAAEQPLVIEFQQHRTIYWCTRSLFYARFHRREPMAVEGTHFWIVCAHPARHPLLLEPDAVVAATPVLRPTRHLRAI